MNAWLGWRRKRKAQATVYAATAKPLEESSFDTFLEEMRRILIIAATVALIASAVRAEDAPSSNSSSTSERGSNFPTSQRGPSFPATTSDQQPNPSFGAQAPASQLRGVPLHAQPENRSSYPSQREDRTRALR